MVLCSSLGSVTAPFCNRIRMCIRVLSPSPSPSLYYPYPYFSFCTYLYHNPYSHHDIPTHILIVIPIRNAILIHIRVVYSYTYRESTAIYISLHYECKYVSYVSLGIFVCPCRVCIYPYLCRCIHIPCSRVSVSVYLCLRASVYPCLCVSGSMCAHVSMIVSPCFHVSTSPSFHIFL